MTRPTDPTAAGPPREPVLAITGPATDEDVAAVTLAVLALSSTAADAGGPAGSGGNGWAAHWRRMGTTPSPGPDTWRMSARP